jgi:hypothetical protein
MISVIGYKKSNVEPQFNSAYNLTDKNWVNGISRSSVAFFVSNIPKNVKKYKVGTKVQFINNEIRTIEKITVSPYYINVFIDGKPLDSLKVGYPNKIEVIKEEHK